MYNIVHKQIARIRYMCTFTFFRSLSSVFFLSPSKRERLRLRTAKYRRHRREPAFHDDPDLCVRPWSPANRDAHARVRIHLWYRTLRCQRRHTCGIHDACIVKRKRERLELELYDSYNSTGSGGNQWYPLLDACPLL